MIDYSNKQKFFVVTAGNGSLKEILTLKNQEPTFSSKGWFTAEL